MNYHKYKLFMKRSYSNHPFDDNKRVLSMFEIKQGLRLICRKYGIQTVYLFGSYAYNNPDRFSDLDFIVDYGKCQGLNCIGFMEELERYFRKGVDVININSVSKILKDEIKERKVLVYDQLWKS